VNALDVVIIATGLGAGWGGWRLGLVARVFAWAGVFIGLAIAVNFVPKVVTALGGTTVDGRIGVALLFLFLVASIGQAFGLVVGLLLHRVFPLPSPLPLWDRIAGAAAGTLGLLVLTWMVIPSLAAAQGWPARMARDSWVVAAIERAAPRQPATFAAWGLAISEAPYPSALGPLDTPPDPGVAPTGQKLTPAVDAMVRRSTVKVTGNACDLIQDGSGWVASPGTVVTNAHVVAGERSTSVVDNLGTRMPAVVVEFDPVRDLAVLSVPTLKASALALANGTTGEVGAVYGHPGGGPLQAVPARIGQEIVAVGTDIYRTSASRRHVFVLAARLAPGDSGGPLVNGHGAVLGVAFAIDPGRRGTSYALTDEEVRPVLAASTKSSHAVGTGSCLVE
jgi:S1-C subfamily serine protease